MNTLSMARSRVVLKRFDCSARRRRGLVLLRTKNMTSAIAISTAATEISIIVLRRAIISATSSA